MSSQVSLSSYSIVVPVLFSDLLLRFMSNTKGVTEIETLELSTILGREHGGCFHFCRPPTAWMRATWLMLCSAIDGYLWREVPQSARCLG